MKHQTTLSSTDVPMRTGIATWFVPPIVVPALLIIMWVAYVTYQGFA